MNPSKVNRHEADSSERRRSSRAPVSRPVLFAGTRGSDILRRGQAVDISAGGILVHTTQPELVGRHLELELHPEEALESGEVIMVKGEVARVVPVDSSGEYAMGVRFLQQVPATENTGARMRPATEDEAKELAGAIQRKLATMEPGARLDVSGAARQAAHKHENKKSARPPAAPPEGRKWWRGLFLLLLLLLLLTAVLVPVLLGARWGLTRLRPISTAPEVVSTPAITREDSPAASTPNVLEQRLAQIEAGGPAYYINRGSYLLVQGKHPAAAQAFQTARAKGELTPVQRFVTDLGEAQALAGEGKTDDAIALLEPTFEEHEFVPEPWLALKAAFLDGLYNHPESPESRMPLVNAFTFQAGPAENGQGGPAPQEGSGNVRIEVDTNRHLLTVLENNSIKAVYPIGLGIDGLTPEGLFAVANKIKNPDWYNKGDVVKAGDPENQLGSRWLGLADEEGPTPVGIHGTDDDRSIGANLSRGCIRMRPADVEELFTYVDVGTPVSIRPL